MQWSYFFVFLGCGLQVSLAAVHDASAVPDSFEIFKNFPTAVAISDVDNDAIFECLTAHRVSLNLEQKTGEYIWLLKGHHGNPSKTVAFYIAAGSTPDTFLYMEGTEDAPPDEGKFLYADIDNCTVMESPYLGGQCILWAKEDKRDSLPQTCLDEFSEICGFGVPTYSKDLCTGEEFLYW